MKGRPKKPTSIKIAEGNRSNVAKSQLKPDPRGNGRPEQPAHLTAAEAWLWHRVVNSLPTELLTRADEAQLERMAVAWAEFREVHEVIKRTSKIVASNKGPQRNPLLVVREKASREMHLASEVLGLSPVARARLSNLETVEQDPMELLLGMDGDPGGAWSTLPKTKN